MIDINWIKKRLQVDRKTLWIYIILYFGWGLLMHHFGIWVEIARFTFWWQVISCYVLYMVPISLILREFHWFQQYAYGLVAMGLLEFGGYALGTSIIFEGNMLDTFFNRANFSLAMALFFAAYFPVGNWAVSKIRTFI